MWWKILLEIFIAIFALTLGTSFWAILKSRSHFQRVLADENELRRCLEFFTPAKVIEEGEKIEPVFGSYLNNISLFEKAHFASLNKTRNLMFIVALVLMVMSYFLGIAYLIATLIAFLLPAPIDMPSSAKSYNMTQVRTVVLNIYKWNKIDRGGCLEYCNKESSGLKQVYRMVNDLG